MKLLILFQLYLQEQGPKEIPEKNKLIFQGQSLIEWSVIFQIPHITSMKQLSAQMI